MLLRTTKMFALVGAVLLSATVVSASHIPGHGEPMDGQADVVYDFLTGGIVIDPDGGDNIGLFQLISDSGIFVATDAVLPPGGLFTTDSDNEIGWATFSATAVNGPIDLGPVAPAGLSLEFLLDDVGTRLSSAGFGTQDGPLGLIVINDIPEPTSLFLAGLGLLGLVGYMRRR